MKDAMLDDEGASCDELRLMTVRTEHTVFSQDFWERSNHSLFGEGANAKPLSSLVEGRK